METSSISRVDKLPADAPVTGLNCRVTPPETSGPVGVVKTMQTKTNPVQSGLENLGLGFVGGLIAFWVGRAFDALIAS